MHRPRRDPWPAVRRREFLRGVSATAFVTLIHGGTADAAASQPTPRRGLQAAPPDPRILDLRLQTAVPLADLRAFYHRSIGFPVLAEGPEEITFAAGRTPLTFVAVDPAGGRPFYHFAFNIPENKIRWAREWQLRRSPLITTPPHLRDAAYTGDVRHFQSWNAHSIFFWDPADNLVEYIARHDLANAAEGKFGTGDILHASEIGFVVEESARRAVSRAMADRLGLPGYEPTRIDDFFWALGDEHGLALLLPRGPRPDVDPAREVEFAVFPTEARLRCARAASHTIEGYPYRAECGAAPAGVTREPVGSGVRDPPFRPAS